jgi:hypothetical protein
LYTINEAQLFCRITYSRGAAVVYDKRSTAVLQDNIEAQLMYTIKEAQLFCRIT